MDDFCSAAEVGFDPSSREEILTHFRGLEPEGRYSTDIMWQQALDALIDDEIAKYPQAQQDDVFNLVVEAGIRTDPEDPFVPDEETCRHGLTVMTCSIGCFEI